MVKGLSILGSTGSIGVQALEVARFLNIKVHALAAGRNVDLLFRQYLEFRPSIIAVQEESDAHRLQDLILSGDTVGRGRNWSDGDGENSGRNGSDGDSGNSGRHGSDGDGGYSGRNGSDGDGGYSGRHGSDGGGGSLSCHLSDRDRCVDIYWGEAGISEAAVCCQSQMVLAAISGAACLAPLIAAINAGKDIALANKEALVMAGGLILDEAGKRGVRVLPVDSEHSAIFQCLGGRDKEHVKHVKRIILTASGGPFRDFPTTGLRYVTPEQATYHPVWKMGRKISVDSATMMNKGLEVIEASWLFGRRHDDIEVLIHPQGVVHSMVMFADNSVIAQMGTPDMRLPIQYAFTYPQRHIGITEELDLTSVGALEFFEPDKERFKCLRLAYDSIKAGGTMPAVMNAANEIAVSLFLAGEIGFDRIPELIESVMLRHKGLSALSLECILEEDRRAREVAVALAKEM